MAEEFEEGLKDLVSEQFKDNEVMPLRDEKTGKFVNSGDAEEPADEEVNENEPGEEVNENEPDSEEAGEGEEGDEEENEEGEEEQPDEGKGKGKGRFQKRVDTLTATVRRLERDLQAEREAKAVAAEREKNTPKRADGTPYTDAADYARDKLKTDDKAPKKPNPAAKGADGKPLYKLGEFDEQYAEDKDDYLDARRRYLDAKEKEYDTAVTAPAVDAAAVQQQEFQTKINSKIEDGKKAYKDFDEKVVKGIEQDAWPLSEAGALFLADSDVGADIAYYLASNVKEAKEIADLSPVQQVKRFTKLEEKLTAEVAAKKAKRGSKAPEPLAHKARGGGRAETNRFDGEDFESVEKNWNAANKAKK
jgi:hypothetical protein